MEFRNRTRDANLYGIYCIENMVTHKKYIGQTGISFISRFWDHQSKLRGGIHKNNAMQTDFDLYGESQFVFYVVEIVNARADLDAAERRWIQRDANCYNVKSGGEKMWVIPASERAIRHNKKTDVKETRHYCISDDVRRKMSTSHTGATHAIYSERNVINDDIACDIKTLLVSGMRPADVAAELCVQYNTVNNILSNNTWKHVEVPGWDEYRSTRSKHYRLTEEDAVQIRNKYQSGNSIQELAQEYHKCRTTIANILRYHTFS